MAQETTDKANRLVMALLAIVGAVVVVYVVYKLVA
jgi:hypothetical protein